MGEVYNTNVRLSASNREFLKDHIPIVTDQRHTTGFSTKINQLVAAKQTELQLIAALERSLDEPLSFEDRCDDDGRDL